ncbi:MAG: hypothetical protein Ct9H90mP7_3190 [Candidatus Neomarinimicrobiota bacterium]|nr:MAG: hypothetical protein Ct9H90mP7_3190 [Candidatus Neomarinimicrobiota bacterium]
MTILNLERLKIDSRKSRHVLNNLYCVLFSTDIMARVFSASFYIPLYILLGLAFFTALCSSLSEMISYRGSDNFSIPLITFFSYEIYLINYTHGSLTDLLLWTVILLLSLFWLIA